jgi:hypothetical protein
MNPDNRFSGHWIVAQQGAGKSNLLLYLIGEDIKRGDCSVMVMDSKGELTQKIRSLDLGDRLIVIDPDYPVAINPFDVKSKNDHVISQLGYLLSGLLETNITPRQRIFFESLVDALLSFPNPSFMLLWDIVSKGPKAYKNEISQLPEDMQNFFWDEWEGFSDTAKEMRWRLRGIFGKKLIKAMLSAPKTKFHISEAMDQRKIVVIDNSQAKCTPEGCGLIGRLFVSMIWSAGTERHTRPDHLKTPTYVYIDEAHLVIKKDQKIAAIIDELRSARIGLILAHQKVRGQIDDLNVISSLENCAIKMVHVKAEVDYFSKLLNIPRDPMLNLKRGQFATDIRWEEPEIIEVPLAQLPCRVMTADQQRLHMEAIYRRYGAPKAPDPTVEQMIRETHSTPKPDAISYFDITPETQKAPEGANRPTASQSPGRNAHEPTITHKPPQRDGLRGTSPSAPSSEADKPIVSRPAAPAGPPIKTKWRPPEK